MRRRWLPLFLSLWWCVSASALGRSPTCHKAFRDDLKKRSLQYFLDHAHPETGLVRDRARNFDATPDQPRYRAASIAATGFGLAVFANAAEQGEMPKAEVVGRVRRTLLFARDRLTRYRGWFYHFVTWDTGVRVGLSEISTVDTALFMAGALYAAYALQSPDLIALAEEIHREINYLDMMTDGGTLPEKRTLSMGWTPETGYLPWQWERYAEHLILIVMGLGHPKYPLPLSAWKTWQDRDKKQWGLELPLFVHQYSHLFVDFRKIPGPGSTLFENSITATRMNKAACRAKADEFLTYARGFWGLSASGSSTGYHAFSPALHNGTVCPGCVAGSAMFQPCPILQDMQKWAVGPFANRSWGVYGFVDSLNLDEPWFDPDVIGITIGAVYLSLANINEDASVWRLFHAVPAAHEGLLRIKGSDGH